MPIFKNTEKLYLDKSKENILIILDNVDVRMIEGKYNHIFGFYIALELLLKDKFNFIYLSFKNAETTKNYINCSSSELKNNISDKFLRKENGKDNYKFLNNELVYNELLNNYINIPDFSYVCFSSPFLPLQKYTFAKDKKNLWNEFFDYVGSDKSEIQIHNELAEYAANRYYEFINPLMFSQFHNNIKVNLLRCIQNKNPDCKFYDFLADPDQFSYLSHKILGDNHTAFFLVEDKRGTRNLNYFPMAELQHFVYDILYKENSNTLFTDDIKQKNTKNFCYIGTFLYEKGNRIQSYYNFFDKLRIDDSVFYTPLHNSGTVIINAKDERQTKKLFNEINKSSFEQIKNDIINHPMFINAVLTPDEVNDTLSQYKYSFINHCVSTADSANFRLYAFIANGVLPIIDETYDPDYLQIPKEFQDKLTVKNHKDIEKLVNYYNENESERKTLLDKLSKYYKIDLWRNLDYAKNEMVKYFRKNLNYAKN